MFHNPPLWTAVRAVQFLLLVVSRIRLSISQCCPDVYSQTKQRLTKAKSKHTRSCIFLVHTLLTLVRRCFPATTVVCMMLSHTRDSWMQPLLPVHTASWPALPAEYESPPVGRVGRYQALCNARAVPLRTFHSQDASVCLEMCTFRRTSQSVHIHTHKEKILGQFVRRLRGHCTAETQWVTTTCGLGGPAGFGAAVGRAWGCWASWGGVTFSSLPPAPLDKSCIDPSEPTMPRNSSACGVTKWNQHCRVFHLSPLIFLKK